MGNSDAIRPFLARACGINTFGTVNIGGTIIIDATGGVGTYTVAADCTGTLSITDGPSFNMYVGPGAQKL